MSSSTFEIEKIVIGAVLLNESCYWEVESRLQPEMFSTENHQKIWQMISAFGGTGKAIRLPLVANRLVDLKDDAEPNTLLSAMVHMAEKEDQLPLSEYAESIFNRWQASEVKRVAEKIVERMNKSDQAPALVADWAVQAFSDISRDSDIENEHSLPATVKQIVDTISADSSGVITPCLNGLTELIGGFFPGDLILWGGGPGAMKTAVAMQQALYSSTANPVGFFELEMSNQKLVMRKIAEMTNIPVKQMLQGLSAEQLEKIHNTAQEFSGHRLNLITPPRMTIRQIEARARSMRRRGEIDFLVVDHIKLIRRQTERNIQKHEIAYENAYDLKCLAKDLNIPIIVLCQFLKSARQSDNPEPQMEDFYGGALEEHADVMLANLNRHEWLKKNRPQSRSEKRMDEWSTELRKSENRIEVHKLKDRTGAASGRHIFGLKAEHTLFYDLSDRQDGFDFSELDPPGGSEEMPF